MELRGALGRPHVPRRAVALAALAAAAFLAGLVAAPLLEPGYPFAARLLRAAYAPLCHQMPERSLDLEGAPLAVCARCAGLYAGGFLGPLAGLLGGARLERVPRAAFVAAVLPTAIDAVLPWLGLPQLGNLARFGVAIPAGVACGGLLAIGVGDLAEMLVERSRRGVRAARAAERAG